MLWSLSGDGAYTLETKRWKAIGAAVDEADAHRHPTTIHLWTRMDWNFLFHAARCLDFHMVQTGHSRWAYPDVTAVPAAYRALTPAKPVANGEPWYEGHPNASQTGSSAQLYAV